MLLFPLIVAPLCSTWLCSARLCSARLYAARSVRRTRQASFENEIEKREDAPVLQSANSQCRRMAVVSSLVATQVRGAQPTECRTILLVYFFALLSESVCVCLCLCARAITWCPHLKTSNQPSDSHRLEDGTNNIRRAQLFTTANIVVVVVVAVLRSHFSLELKPITAGSSRCKLAETFSPKNTGGNDTGDETTHLMSPPIACG